MKTYKIDSKNPVIIRPKEPFYGENSLLSIKAVSWPFEKANFNLQFQVVYKNAAGHSWSAYVNLDPPYFFNAITVDLRHMDVPRPSPAFTWIEIKVVDNSEYVIQVSFNPKLNRNMDPFFTKGKFG